jgi:nucleoside-diphosphate-sugar epimerase
MPVIVVGADTPLGTAIVAALLGRQGEVRAFVSDPGEALRLKALGVKVAVGDVSDASHVGAACTNCFSAVLVGAAADDGRDRDFASEAAAVLAKWAEAVREAAVRRVIWVVDGRPPSIDGAETARVDAGLDPATIAARVAELDDAAVLGPNEPA